MDLRLSFRVAAERVRAQIDNVTLVVEPRHGMPEFVNSDGGEMRRRAEPGKNLPLRDQRPEVDDAFVAVVEGDPQHAMDDRLRFDDTGRLFHSIGPCLTSRRHTADLT
jgi:hypothetical protein